MSLVAVGFVAVGLVPPAAHPPINLFRSHPNRHISRIIPREIHLTASAKQAFLTLDV
jgi:hypothetical protein